MKHLLLLITIIVGFSKTMIGQTQLTISQPFTFDKGYSTYIFADTARIRIEPGLKAETMDTLVAGDEITITEVSEIKTSSSGKKAPWYQVSYLKNGVEKRGYIWGALLSFSAHRRGTTKFVYGIEKVASITHQEEDYTWEGVETFITIKVIESGTVKDKVSARFSGTDSANSPSASVSDNRGLTNVQHVFKCTFSGNACAVPTYDFYVLWNGNTLYALPVLTSSVDAVEEGAIGENQEYSFPKDPGGTPDQIILYKLLSDYDKNDKIVDTKTYTYYNWNGSTLKVLPKKRE